jgi:hypothetical protein
VALQFGDVPGGLGKITAYLIAIHSAKDAGGFAHEPDSSASALCSCVEECIDIRFGGTFALFIAISPTFPHSPS